jgi:hypothetical protein
MPEIPNERNEEKVTIAALKGSRQYLEWFHRLREHTRLPAAVLLDAALVSFARRTGFEEPPQR